MIKIEKNFLAIPQSLIPAFNDLFPDLTEAPLISKNTHKKRMEIINGEAYIDKEEYNNKYKRDDIKTALNEIYKSKCAYCEWKVEQLNIEHYRPKSKYYWLAFSWDNLILACPTCNQNKGINFELVGDQVKFDPTEINLRNINNCSPSYDLIEQPKIVNPEITDPEGHIKFEKDGVIKSDDNRFAYTINKCKLDRKWLNDERKHLLDVFERHIRSALVESKSPDEQKIVISSIVIQFVRDSKDLKLQFLGFRRFAISIGWLSEIVQEMN